MRAVPLTAVWILLTMLILLFPLEKEKTKLQEETSSSNAAETSAEFDEAFAQLCDPLLPIRGHAIMKLASLIHHRDPKAVDTTDTLLKIFLEQLTHDDSYIYLAAIQGLVSLADVRADTVIPQLAREFASCRKEAADITTRTTKDVNEKGYYKPDEKGWFWFLTRECESNERVLAFGGQILLGRSVGWSVDGL